MKRSFTISLLLLACCIPASTSELSSSSTMVPFCPKCDCEEEGESGEQPQQPQDKNSGGALKLTTLQTSQTTCVSPCTVMFSVEDVEDPTTDKPFTDLGYHWDYGDPGADETKGAVERGGDAFLVRTTEQTGITSRNSDTNTALGMHTYTCEQKECTFYPGVAVSNAAGDWATKWASVTILGQDEAFPGEQTVCVSQAGNWTGCPEGSRQESRLPQLGQWESDTRYLLRSGETFARTCMQYDINNITLAPYGQGDRPEILGELAIGRDRSCNDPLPPSSSGFTNPYWVSNITLEGLRLQEVDLGMTFRDITLHDLDMDFEKSSARGGWIRASSTDGCTRQSYLTCSDIPTPQGVYITDSRVIGSRQNLPGLNIEFLSSSCVSYFGVYNTEMQVAFEHNLRLECASRVLTIHNDVNGDHLGNRGRKHAITIRPEGYSTDDMLGGMRRSNSNGSASQYGNRYVSIVDNYLGKPGLSPNNAARITIAPTNRGEAETTYGGLVSRNIADVTTVPSNDVQLSGVDLVCYDDNRWQSRNQCVDSGPGSTPSSAYERAVTSQAPPEVPKSPSEY